MNGYTASSPATLRPVPDNWDFWRGMPLIGAGIERYGMKRGDYTLVKRDRPSDTPSNVPDPNLLAYQTKQLGDVSANLFLPSLWKNTLSPYNYNPSLNPFFLVVAPTAPHTMDRLYDGVAGNEPPNGDTYTGASPHPQFTERVFADRNGYFGYSTTDYALYGCTFPAGCLRGGNVDGSTPNAGFDLPSFNTAAFNQPNSCADKPSWICQRWINIAGTDLSNLRRQHLEDV